MEPAPPISIRIEGRAFRVPAGETLLTCIQDIVKAEFPVMGRFCWSNECGNCELSVRRRDALLPLPARGCRTIVEEGMEISELTPELRYFIHHKLV
ncbi:MAG: 2Fe-2S iron-sulfur cluster-binding protein [Vicinamibacteria bacterium]